MTLRALVEYAIALGHAGELERLIRGDSSFWSDQNHLRLSSREQELRSYALHHLDFVARFGSGASRFWRGNYLECPLPEEFEAWIVHGSPGLARRELIAFLSSL